MTKDDVFRELLEDWEDKAEKVIEDRTPSEEVAIAMVDMRAKRQSFLNRYLGAS